MNVAKSGQAVMVLMPTGQQLGTIDKDSGNIILLFLLLQIQSFLLHFWQGMPAHIVPILGSTALVSLVGVCDHILYKSITGVLMPTVLQALPDSHTQVCMSHTHCEQVHHWCPYTYSVAGTA